MPLYEYECQQHGTFDELRPYAESDAPIDCPVCERPATRVVSMPRFRQMDAGTVKAMDINEKSRHEPHVCTSGCSHHRRPAANKNGEPQKPQRQAYTGPRPWVVEHA